MVSLKKLCLENICSNLEFNYLICKWNKWMIPQKIADSILEYSRTYKFPIMDKDVNIFKREVMKLSNFCSSTRIFQIFNYNFLNGHQFETLELKFLEDFYLDVKNCKIHTKKLVFHHVNLDKFSSEELEKLFRHSIQVEEAIFIQDTLNVHPESFFHSIYQPSNSLKELYFHSNIFKLDEIQRISLILQNLNQLERFKLKFRFIPELFETHVDELILNPLKNSFTTMKNLSIKGVNCTLSGLVSFVSSLKNLEKLTLSCLFMTNNESFKNFFVVLREMNLKNFRKLKCNHCHLRPGEELEFIRLINFYRKSLKILKCNFHETFNKTVIKKLKRGLSFEIGNLSQLSIGQNMCGHEFLENTSIVLHQNCSNLEKIEIFSGNFLIDYKSAIENCFDTLNDIKIERIGFGELPTILSAIQKVTCLKNFLISSLFLTIESVNILKEIIDKQISNLTQLQITQNHFTNLITLFDSISNCSNLVHLEIDGSGSAFGDFDNTLGTLKFLHKIEYLKLIFENLNQLELNQLGDNLKNSFQLKYLYIHILDRSTSIFKDFVKKIQHLRPTIEEYRLKSKYKTLRYDCLNKKSFKKDIITDCRKRNKLDCFDSLWKCFTVNTR